MDPRMPYTSGQSRWHLHSVVAQSTRVELALRRVRSGRGRGSVDASRGGAHNSGMHMQRACAGMTGPVPKMWPNAKSKDSRPCSPYLNPHSVAVHVTGLLPLPLRAKCTSQYWLAARRADGDAGRAAQVGGLPWVPRRARSWPGTRVRPPPRTRTGGRRAAQGRAGVADHEERARLHCVLNPRALQARQASTTGGGGGGGRRSSSRRRCHCSGQPCVAPCESAASSQLQPSPPGHT